MLYSALGIAIVRELRPCGEYLHITAPNEIFFLYGIRTGTLVLVSFEERVKQQFMDLVHLPCILVFSRLRVELVKFAAIQCLGLGN